MANAKKRIWLRILLIVLAAVVVAAALSAPVWIYLLPRRAMEFPLEDISYPDIANAYASQEAAQQAGGGWYVTMLEDFEGDTLPEPWVPSPHGKRNTEYWCDKMVRLQDGQVQILAATLENHECDVCEKSDGDFTSGIETRKMVDGESIPTFTQAFGYFEATVTFPTGPGLWSAFWLQSNSMGQIGNRGQDGSEIDIYESAFHYEPTKMGHCIHWDGYDLFHGQGGTVVDTGTNLYDGSHTFGLLWTPESYTMFIDGKPTWSTNAGGVSCVPEFLRLTVEIRHTTSGPYGAKLGEFTATEANPDIFYIDTVKVYQHTDFLPHIQNAADFDQPFWAKWVT